MDFGVLGRLTVTRDGRDVAPRGPLQRRLLCALLLRADSVVAADELADLLWPDRLPANHLAALQTHVFRLRRLLPEGVVDSSPPDPGPRPRVSTRPWAGGGAPYDELADVDAARIEAGRLTELQLRATEERHDCLLELGRYGDVVADLEAFAAHHPLRERPQTQLMGGPPSWRPPRRRAGCVRALPPGTGERPLRSGRTDLARALISERLAVRPTSAYAQAQLGRLQRRS